MFEEQKKVIENMKTEMKNLNFKDIHIGQMIEKRVAESGIELSRICNFLKCSEEDILKMYQSKSLDTEVLLRCSKLLEYDFFRIYTQHLILYAPPSAENKKEQNQLLPRFRKNIYMKEVIDFILELIESGEKTKVQIMEEYNIPKTTLYKWISKFKKDKETKYSHLMGKTKEEIPEERTEQ